MITKILKPFFWYTDNKNLKTVADQTRIITQILRFGDSQSVKWLFKHYSRATIKKVVRERGFLELDDKSFNYWCLVLKIDKRQVKKTRL